MINVESEKNKGKEEKGGKSAKENNQQKIINFGPIFKNVLHNLTKNVETKINNAPVQTKSINEEVSFSINDYAQINEKKISQEKQKENSSPEKKADVTDDLDDLFIPTFSPLQITFKPRKRLVDLMRKKNSSPQNKEKLSKPLPSSCQDQEKFPVSLPTSPQIKENFDTIISPNKIPTVPTEKFNFQTQENENQFHFQTQEEIEKIMFQNHEKNKKFNCQTPDENEKFNFQNLENKIEPNNETLNFQNLENKIQPNQHTFHDEINPDKIPTLPNEKLSFEKSFIEDEVENTNQNKSSKSLTESLQKQNVENINQKNNF